VSNHVTPFRFEQHDVRVVDVAGEPWFVASDVARVLGYARPNDAVNQHVRDKHRSTTANDRSGPDLVIVNEPGLYSLIFGSKLESAERFRDWVFEEVLPQIRKSGGYEERQQDSLDAAQNIINAIREDRARIGAVESRQDVMESQLTGVLGQHGEFTTLGFAKLRGLPTDRTSCQRHGQRASKLMRDRGQVPRKREDATFGAINVYPLDVLDATATSQS
jgi:prophage antirepressor-like protein